MEYDVIARNRPIIPFQANARWDSGEGKLPEKLDYKLIIVGARKHEIMMSSPDECLGK